MTEQKPNKSYQLKCNAENEIQTELIKELLRDIWDKYIYTDHHNSGKFLKVCR